MDTRRRQETIPDDRTREETIRRSEQTRRPRDVPQGEMAREEIRRDTRGEMTRLNEIKEEDTLKKKKKKKRDEIGNTTGDSRRKEVSE